MIAFTDPKKALLYLYFLLFFAFWWYHCSSVSGLWPGNSVPCWGHPQTRIPSRGLSYVVGVPVPSPGPCCSQSVVGIPLTSSRPALLPYCLALALRSRLTFPGGAAREVCRSFTSTLSSAANLAAICVPGWGELYGPAKSTNIAELFQLFKWNILHYLLANQSQWSPWFDCHMGLCILNV